MLHGPTLQGPRLHNPLLQGLWDTVLCLMVLRWRYRVLMVLCYTVFCITVLRYKVLRYTFLCNTVLYYTVHSPVCMVLCYTVIYYRYRSYSARSYATVHGPTVLYVVWSYSSRSYTACMLYTLSYTCTILHGHLLEVLQYYYRGYKLCCMVLYWKCYHYRGDKSSNFNCV